MNRFQKFAVGLALFCAATGAARAQSTMPINLLVLMPGDKPQVDAFTERLRKVPYLANSTEKAKGSNIVLMVSVAQVPTSGGAAASATTGLLAASTLGLIPTVENKDVSVHYELRANYITVASFDYNHNFTSVSNIFGQFGKLPDDAREWLMQTVGQLENDLKASAPAVALEAEYVSYFAKP